MNSECALTNDSSFIIHNSGFQLEELEENIEDAYRLMLEDGQESAH
jgi:hypothetical protein